MSVGYGLSECNVLFCDEKELWDITYQEGGLELGSIWCKTEVMDGKLEIYR